VPHLLSHLLTGEGEGGGGKKKERKRKRKEGKKSCKAVKQQRYNIFLEYKLFFLVSLSTHCITNKR
jgi:hypothetical protein